VQCVMAARGGGNSEGSVLLAGRGRGMIVRYFLSEPNQMYF